MKQKHKTWQQVLKEKGTVGLVSGGTGSITGDFYKKRRGQRWIT